MAYRAAGCIYTEVLCQPGAAWWVGVFELPFVLCAYRECGRVLPVSAGMVESVYSVCVCGAGAVVAGGVGDYSA